MRVIEHLGRLNAPILMIGLMLTLSGCLAPVGYVNEISAPPALVDRPIDRIAVLPTQIWTGDVLSPKVESDLIDGLRRHDAAIIVMPSSEAIARIKAAGLYDDLARAIYLWQTKAAVDARLFGRIGEILGVDALMVTMLGEVRREQGGAGRESMTGVAVLLHLLGADDGIFLWSARGTGFDFVGGFSPPPSPELATGLAFGKILGALPAFRHRQVPLRNP